MQLIMNILAGIGLASLIGSFALVTLAWLGLLPAMEDPSSPYYGEEWDEGEDS